MSLFYNFPTICWRGFNILKHDRENKSKFFSFDLLAGLGLSVDLSVQNGGDRKLIRQKGTKTLCRYLGFLAMRYFAVMCTICHIINLFACARRTIQMVLFSVFQEYQPPTAQTLFHPVVCDRSSE
mmetsp:Transcript_21620/g.30119  ORF Transcript_21620/g.30119 Transcript_21620/m.30119 type:complete len:125 (-) Transcript_21620:596-970(-)